MASRLSVALYRALLRWSNRCGDAPPLRHWPPQPLSADDGRQQRAVMAELLASTGVSLSGVLAPAGPSAERFVELQLGAATAKCEIRQLSRLLFSCHIDAQGAAAAEAQDAGFAALRLLNQKFSPVLSRMNDFRATHARGDSMQYHIGQVLQHEGQGYHGVVIGWERGAEGDQATSASPAAASPGELGESAGDDAPADVVTYHLLADEVEATKALDGKYLPSSALCVAEDELQVASEVRRIRNRHILDFFQAFSTPSGRYLPKYALQYFYPDHYGSNDEEGTVPCNDDANILFFEATDT
eukprot:jgi/Tetstr1/430208/TSEL_020037.t1